MVNQREQKRLARAAEKDAAIQARADAWQARVNTHFAYLQTTYNFHITQVDASSTWNKRVTYQTATVGIYVDCNYEEELVKQRALEHPQTIKIYSKDKPITVIKVWPPEENPSEWVTRLTNINRKTE